MMAKESVKKRVSGEGDGMSFTEFTYQLFQGYDYLHLYEKEACKLQIGGSDQWGNITTGTELIRRKARGKAYAITTPLVTKADGTKFGKRKVETFGWMQIKLAFINFTNFGSQQQMMMLSTGSRSSLS